MLSLIINFTFSTLYSLQQSVIRHLYLVLVALRMEHSLVLSSIMYRITRDNVCIYFWQDLANESKSCSLHSICADRHQSMHLFSKYLISLSIICQLIRLFFTLFIIFFQLFHTIVERQLVKYLRKWKIYAFWFFQKKNIIISFVKQWHPFKKSHSFIKWHDIFVLDADLNTWTFTRRCNLLIQLIWSIHRLADDIAVQICRADEYHYIEQSLYRFIPTRTQRPPNCFLVDSRLLMLVSDSDTVHAFNKCLYVLVVFSLLSVHCVQQFSKSVRQLLGHLVRSQSLRIRINPTFLFLQRIRERIQKICFALIISSANRINVSVSSFGISIYFSEDLSKC